MEIPTTSSIDFTRLFDLINYQIEKYPNERAFNYYEKNKWNPISIKQFKLCVDSVSCWFIEKEYKNNC